MPSKKSKAKKSKSKSSPRSSNKKLQYIVIGILIGLVLGYIILNVVFEDLFSAPRGGGRSSSSSSGGSSTGDSSGGIVARSSSGVAGSSESTTGASGGSSRGRWVSGYYTITNENVNPDGTCTLTTTRKRWGCFILTTRGRSCNWITTREPCPVTVDRDSTVACPLILIACDRCSTNEEGERIYYPCVTNDYGCTEGGEPITCSSGCIHDVGCTDSTVGLLRGGADSQINNENTGSGTARGRV